MKINTIQISNCELVVQLIFHAYGGKHVEMWNGDEFATLSDFAAILFGGTLQASSLNRLVVSMAQQLVCKTIESNL